jgi:hypothetical protein
MGGTGNCECSGGGCSCNGNGNGSGTNGGAKAAAGYNGVNQGRMQMPGPFLVRKPAALVNGANAVTGDGKGSENPVPVAGSNQVVLLVDGNKGASTNNLNVYMEITINGTDYYRETDIGSGSTAAVTKKTYQVAAGVLGASTDERLAIPINVLAAFARFSFQLVSGATDYTNVACRAITGRV